MEPCRSPLASADEPVGALADLRFDKTMSVHLLSEANTLRLNAAQRAAMSEEAWGVHRQIFDGVDRAAFVRALIEPDAHACRMRIFRDAHGAAIGYAAMYHLTVEVDGQTYGIIRGAGGLLPDHRGRTVLGPYLARLVISMRLAHIGRPVYIFACPINPLMYAAADRALATCWPHPHRPTPPAEQRLMNALGERFGLAGEGPSRHVGWTVRELNAERLRRSTDPAVQYYLKHCPRYADGYGLMTLCPITLENIRSGIGRVIQTRGRRRSAA